MSSTFADEPPVRARIPADLDAPDRVMAGLTARQVAVLAAAAVPVYLAWQQLAGRIPIAVLAAATTPVVALAVGLALGRRDGQGLDVWLLAAFAHRRQPRRLVPVFVDSRATPAWAPETIPAAPSARVGRLGVLRLPASTVSPDGTIATGSRTAVSLVAATTVTASLHTNAEQAGLVAGYARWLNGLSGPVQIVVSARRVDLGVRALRVAEQAHRLPHPTLAGAAVDYAEFLLDLSEQTDPLERTVTIACAGSGPPRDAQRRAANTVEALSAVGSRCKVLDASEVTAVLTAATDPFGPSDAQAPRTPPNTAVTFSSTASPFPGIWDDRQLRGSGADWPYDPDVDVGQLSGNQPVLDDASFDSFDDSPYPAENVDDGPGDQTRALLDGRGRWARW